MATIFVVVCAVLLSHCVCAQAVDQADEKALYDLRDAFQNKMGWNGNASCDWVGILCLPPPLNSTALARILQVTIELNSTGFIPNSIGSLTAIQALQITANLNRSIPTTMRSLNDLIILDIKSGVSSTGAPTAPSQLFPDWIASLPNLTAIVFQNFDFRGSSAPSLSNLTKLRYLEMINTNSGGLFPTLNSSAIVGLNLEYNGFVGSIPAFIGQLPALQYLYLGHNKFTGSIPDLSGLDDLINLDLSYNQLSGAIPDLSELDDLQTLAFQNNALTGNISAALGDTDDLRACNVSSNAAGLVCPQNLRVCCSAYIAGNNTAPVTTATTSTATTSSTTRTTSTSSAAITQGVTSLWLVVFSLLLYFI